MLSYASDTLAVVFGVRNEMLLAVNSSSEFQLDTRQDMILPDSILLVANPGFCG